MALGCAARAGLPAMAVVGNLLRVRTPESIRLDPRIALVALGFAAVGCYGGLVVRRTFARITGRGWQNHPWTLTPTAAGSSSVRSPSRALLSRVSTTRPVILPTPRPVSNAHVDRPPPRLSGGCVPPLPQGDGRCALVEAGQRARYVYMMMIETKRLLLRRMSIEDIDDLLLIFTDPKVMASFDDQLFDRSMMEQWIRRNLDHQDQHGYGLFSVLLRGARTVIGDCGLEHMTVDGMPELELGYDFRSDHWNRGLATEAALAVRDFAFKELGMPRLVSLIRSSNAASCRVAEKIGMSREREVARAGHEYWIYSISRSESSFLR